MKTVREQAIRHIDNKLRRLKQNVVSVSKMTIDRVIGMNIYVQDSEPEVSGDYIWINTNVNQFSR